MGVQAKLIVCTQNYRPLLALEANSWLLGNTFSASWLASCTLFVCTRVTLPLKADTNLTAGASDSSVSKNATWQHCNRKWFCLHYWSSSCTHTIQMLAKHPIHVLRIMNGTTHNGCSKLWKFEGNLCSFGSVVTGLYNAQCSLIATSNLTSSGGLCFRPTVSGTMLSSVLKLTPTSSTSAGRSILTGSSPDVIDQLPPPVPPVKSWTVLQELLKTLSPAESNKPAVVKDNYVMYW